MAYFSTKSNNRRMKSQFFEKIFFLIWEQSHNFRCLFFLVVVVIVPLKKCNSKIIF